MKKHTLLIASAFLFSCITASCDKNDEKEGGENYMFNLCLLGNPKSLDPQFANDESSNTVIANLYSGLLKMDESGTILCDNAESYTISPDGKSYTFKLRQDNYWFIDKNKNDKADEGEYFNVRANDYVFAFERLLNPETQSPFAESFICIEGASDRLNGSSDSVSGVTAADDYTLIINLDYANANFLNLMTSQAVMPCNEEFFYSTKGRYGLDDKSVMSNGSFFMRQWFYDPYGKNNILYMKPNAVNSENDEVYPSYLNFDIEKKQSDIITSFKKGDTECFTSMNFDSSFNKNKYYYKASRSLTLGLIFNPDDKTYSNKSLQKAIAYSINKAELEKELNNDLKAAYGLIPDGIRLLGRSYRELCSDKDMDIYNKSTALDCLEQAKSQLKVESFNSVKILVSTDTINSEYIHLLSQQWQETLGFYIGVDEVSDEEFYSRLNTGDYSIALYPITANYNSGVSFLDSFSDNPYFKISDDNIHAVKQLDHISNSSDYVKSFKDIEQKILNECCFVPVFYKNTYLVMKKENEDILYDAFSKSVNYQYAKHYD